MKTLFENWRRYLEEVRVPPEELPSKIDIEKEEDDEEGGGGPEEGDMPSPEEEEEPEEPPMEEGCGGNVSDFLDDPGGTGHATWRNKKGVASITILDEQ